MAYSASTSTLLLVTYFAATAVGSVAVGPMERLRAPPSDRTLPGARRRGDIGLRREHVLRHRGPNSRVPRDERLPARHRVLVSTAGSFASGSARRRSSRLADDREGTASVDIDETRETENHRSSASARRAVIPSFSRSGRRPGDEWRAGEVLTAFHGSGAVRVLRHSGGASLLERAMPGDSFVELSTSGRDDEATDILADDIRRMSAGATHCDAPSAADWGRSFATYQGSGDTRIPRDLVAEAASVSRNSARHRRTRGCSTAICNTTTSFATMRADGWRSTPKASSPKPSTRSARCFEIPANVRRCFSTRRRSRGVSTAFLRYSDSTHAGSSNGDSRKRCCRRCGPIEDGQFDANYSALKLAGVLERLLAR